MSKESIFNEKYNKILTIVAGCCFFFIILFFIYGNIVSPKLELFRESASVYEEKWIREMDNGNLRVYKMPLTLPLEDDEKALFYTVLPDDVEDGMYLVLNTGKCFTMSIDGKEIYTFDNNVSRVPGNITKAVVVPVPLEGEYAGKKVTMVMTNGKYDRNSVNTAYIGNLMGVVLLLAKSYGLQFVMALLLVIAALVTIGIFTYIEKRDDRKAPLIYLAEGILLICMWIIFDSPLFQMVFGVYFFDGVAGFMLVTTMAYPFLMYFDAISEYRRHMMFAICETVIIANFVVLTFLHLTGIRSFDRSLVYVDLMLLVYIVVMIACTLRDYVVGKDKSHRNVIIGLIGLGIFGFFEIVVTILYANIAFKIDIGGLSVLIGMIFLLLFAILDQVKIFEVLRRETQNALAATKAKSDFLANMSHEIRTPINAIMGMNEMILRECEQDAIKDYAKDINIASENLLSIVNDILDFSKIESGKLELICDDYDLGEMIYDVVTLVNMKAEDKGLKLNIQVDEQLPCKLHGDDKRVREIITNILNNAVKYTEKGYVNLKVGGRNLYNNLMLEISVEDSGQGIRKEDIDSIFNSFSQTNVKKNKNIEGTGLGLTITKKLVEMMGGTISVESEFGKGSTFTVIFPQEIVSHDKKIGSYMDHRHMSSDKSGQEYRIPEMPNTKILVVDDTALNLKVISKLLSKTQAQITCASGGEEMLKLIQENCYDIIFLDHMMPNMDGIETLKASRELENNKCMNVPVIALTANAIVGAKEMYLEAGFDDYLSKPVKMIALCEMIKRYMIKNGAV